MFGPAHRVNSDRLKCPKWMTQSSAAENYGAMESTDSRQRACNVG